MATRSLLNQKFINKSMSWSHMLGGPCAISTCTPLKLTKPAILTLGLNRKSLTLWSFKIINWLLARTDNTTTHTMTNNRNRIRYTEAPWHRQWSAAASRHPRYKMHKLRDWILSWNLAQAYSSLRNSTTKTMKAMKMVLFLRVVDGE